MVEGFPTEQTLCTDDSGDLAQQRGGGADMGWIRPDLGQTGLIWVTEADPLT